MYSVARYYSIRKHLTDSYPRESNPQPYPIDMDMLKMMWLSNPCFIRGQYQLKDECEWIGYYHMIPMNK